MNEYEYLNRKDLLSFWGVVLMGIGVMIGVGIFVLIG